MIDALDRLDPDPDVDVIVIARGGGSVEDLLPFSDEALVRAVARPHPGGLRDRPRARQPAARPRRRRPRLDADRRRQAGRARRRRGDRAAVTPSARPAPLRLATWLDREQERLDALRSRPAMADPRTGLDRPPTRSTCATAPVAPSATGSTAPPTTSATSARERGRSRRWPRCQRGYAVLQDADGHVVTSVAASPRQAPSERPGRRRPRAGHHHRRQHGHRPDPAHDRPQEEPR